MGQTVDVNNFTNENLKQGLEIADRQLKLFELNLLIGASKASLWENITRKKNDEAYLVKLLAQVDELKKKIEVTSNTIREIEARIVAMETIQINFAENRAMSTLFKEEI